MHIWTLLIKVFFDTKSENPMSDMWISVLVFIKRQKNSQKKESCAWIGYEVTMNTMLHKIIYLPHKYSYM